LSSRSKPRKHGKYLNGRPWPIACPWCRNCGNGEPTHFYNSRGLCNICHKLIRADGPEALEEWEPLPSEANDKSWRDLGRDPEKWLKKYMTGEYAKPFIARGLQATQDEAVRLFQSIIDRWYGVEKSPSVVYADTPLEELIWSSSPAAEAVEPATLGKTAEQVKQDAQRSRRRRSDRRRFYQWWDREGCEQVIRDSVKQRPKIYVEGDTYMVAWERDGWTVGAMGEVGMLPSQITVMKEMDITVYAFDPDTLRDLVSTLMA